MILIVFIYCRCINKKIKNDSIPVSWISESHCLTCFLNWHVQEPVLSSSKLFFIASSEILACVEIVNSLALCFFSVFVNIIVIAFNGLKIKTIANCLLSIRHIIFSKKFYRWLSYLLQVNWLIWGFFLLLRTLYFINFGFYGLVIRYTSYFALREIIFSKFCAIVYLLIHYYHPWQKLWKWNSR